MTAPACTPEQVAAWLALAEKATPGPWKDCRGANNTGCICGLVWSLPGDVPVASTNTDSKEEGLSSTAERKQIDAAFIAAAREAVPLLCSEVDRLRGLVNDLTAERGVILNSAEMVARYALPFFEKDDQEHGSHDTAELVSACMGAIQKRTPATNDISVNWMMEMRRDRDILRAQLAQAQAERDSAYEKAAQVARRGKSTQTSPNTIADDILALAGKPAKETP